MRYKVHLAQTVYEVCHIFVDADDEKDAELEALRIAEKEELEWNMADVQGDFEVTKCEPWSTSQLILKEVK